MRRLTLAFVLILSLLLGLPVQPAQALTYPQVILLSQPERYYRLDDASGGTAVDSAWGVTGTYVGSVNRSQSGAIYDGNTAIATETTYTGYVSSPSIGVVNRSFACEFWFYPKTIVGTGNMSKKMCSVEAGSEAWTFNWAHSNSTGLNNLQFVHAGGTLTLSNAVNLNAWHHVIVQFNYTTTHVEIYLDSTLISTTTDSAFTTVNATAYLGAGSANMPTAIDEWAIYYRVLTQGEINDHYNTAASALTTPTPTVTYTPSITPTPTFTFTPTDTPTPTVTPTLTPGWDYEIPLPSGRTAAVRMEATAGDVTIIMLLVFAVAIMLLTVYLRRRSNGS